MSKNSALHSDLTKKMLATSLKKLMAEKPLNAITVNEITTGCNLHRQTFYYHFDDVYELVRWMYKNEAINRFVIGTDKSMWEEKLLNIFDYIDKNKAVCLCTLDSLEREVLKEFILKYLEDAIRDVIEEYGREVIKTKLDASDMSDTNDISDTNGISDTNDISDTNEIEQEFINYIAMFYTYAIAGIIEGYIRGEVCKTPEEIIENMRTVVDNQVAGATLRLMKDNRFGR